MDLMDDIGPVIVTGASGFLGANLVRSLCRSDVAVTAVVRKNSDLWRLADLKALLSIAVVDLANTEELIQLCRDVQPKTIFHMAGDTGCRRFDGDWTLVHRAMNANVLAPVNLVQAAQMSGAPVRQLIRAGGLEEYGSGAQQANEDQREAPTSPYSASQTSTTHWFQMLQPHVDFSLVTLRPALVYGPAQNHDFLIPALINALLKGERFATTGGTQKRDLLYVDDFTEALLRAACGRDLRGAVLNISSDKSYRMHDVALQIAKLLEKEHLLDIGAAPRRPMDLPEVSGEIRRAATMLDWTPQTSLAKGIAKTVKWYREKMRKGHDDHG